MIEGDRSKHTHEITLEEGTRAYFLPNFCDTAPSANPLRRFLSGGIAMPVTTDPETVRQRMNTYFRKIEEQGGQVIGFITQATLYDAYDAPSGFNNFILIKK